MILGTARDNERAEDVAARELWRSSSDAEAVLKVLTGRCTREDNALFELHRLRSTLKNVIVCGIKDVSRAIITLKEESEKTAEERATGDLLQWSGQY